MRKKILILFAIILLMYSNYTIFASSTSNSLNTTSLPSKSNNQIEYKDLVANIAEVPEEDGKINLYFFYGSGCIACDDSQVMVDDLKQTYPNYLNVYTYETWHNDDNAKLL